MNVGFGRTIGRLVISKIPTGAGFRWWQPQRCPDASTSRKSALWHLWGIDVDFPKSDSLSDEGMDLALVVFVSADELNGARHPDAGPTPGRFAGNRVSKRYGSCEYPFPRNFCARAGRSFPSGEFLLARSHRYPVHRSSVRTGLKSNKFRADSSLHPSLLNGGKSLF